MGAAPSFAIGNLSPLSTMNIGLSTNWNAKRQATGEALVDEILSLGFDALELGYNTTDEHMKGIRLRLQSGAVVVNSVHAYCPVPIGAPHGYPELHLLASLEEDERALAAVMINHTRDFAESVGAKAMVLHAGRVFLDSFLFGNLGSGKLESVAENEGSISSPQYRRLLDRAWRRREKRAAPVMDAFSKSLEKLLPSFEKARLLLCLENLPSIEGFPDEREIETLCARFKGSPLRYWHDMGHGQVRAQMGWIANHAATAKALLPITGGIHIHDAAPLTHDHLPPGEGRIPFKDFSFYAADTVIKVFEPAPDVPPDVLANSLRFVRDQWK
jgi:sugar phosphate isomerase/epimerase